MTSEELLNAIGQVDDDLIQEAEEYRPPAKVLLFARWKPLIGGLAAACLVAAALTHLPTMGNLAGGGASADATTAGQAESSAGMSGGAADSGGGSVGNGLPSAPAAPSDGESASPSQEQQGESSVLRTPAGDYSLTGEVVSELPENSRQLGVLFLEGEDSESQLYTDRKEYAGCMLWEGPDGTLYVQLPGGGYALARGRS